MTDRQTDRQTDGQTDRRTDGRPGKNNMSPDPKGGETHKYQGSRPYGFRQEDFSMFFPI